MEFKKSAASTWIPWTVLRGDLTEEYITDVEDGVAYDVRIRSENYAAAVSSWVSDSITVGQKTSAPTAPSNVTTRGPTLTDSVPIQYSTTTGGISYATIVTWDSPADIDVVAVELSLQSGTSSPSSGGSKPTSGLYTPEQGEKGVPYYLDNPSFLSSSVWARFWDASGNSSSWSYEGTTANWSASYSGNITQQDADDVNVTGISTGDGSSVQKILAVYAPNPVISLTGGSPSETFTVDLTNRGFSTKPDTGLIQCMTDANIVGYYDFDNASNTSTTAYFYVETRDGTNLPSGYQRFSIQVIEYD